MKQRRSTRRGYNKGGGGGLTRTPAQSTPRYKEAKTMVIYAIAYITIATVVLSLANSCIN